VDKALGNIKNSHKAIMFIGIFMHSGKNAKMIHY
jgi:hypothetical protein